MPDNQLQQLLGVDNSYIKSFIFLDDDRVDDFLLQSRLHRKIPQDFVNHSCPALQEGLEPYFSHSSPRKKEKSQLKLGMSKKFCLTLQYQCHVEQILR